MIVAPVLVKLGVSIGAIDETRKTHSSLFIELNESYVGLRYDSIFTGIANQNLNIIKMMFNQKWIN